MPSLIEPLHRGLVDKPDPSTLIEGELTRTDDCYYPPDERTLRRAPGRGLVTTLGGQAQLSGAGLFHFTFDDDLPVFVIRNEASIQAFVKGAEKTLATLTPSSPLVRGEAPTAAHYANTYYLMDGKNPAQVIRQSIVEALKTGENVTLDRMGMLDVTEAPGLGQRSDAGDGDFHDTGTFWYLVTEYDIDEDVESGTTAEPSTIGISSTAGVSVVVTRPAIRNTRATHWIVYRAQSTTQPGLNLFVRVAVVDVEAGQWADDDGTGGSVDSLDATLTASNLTGTNWGDLAFAVDGNAATFAYSIEVGTSNALIVHDAWSTSEQTTLDTGLPVSGVEITTRASGVGYIAVQLSPDGGTTWLRAGPSLGGGAEIPPMAHFVQLTPFHREITWGGELNPWYDLTNLSDIVRYAWQAGDFANGQFRIRVFNANIAAEALPQIGLHEIAVTIYINGQAVSAAPIGEFFPTLPIAIPGGPVAVSPANGPPTIASTATVFEASLVLNDVNDPSRIVWSQADAVETFPPAYFLNIETPDRDEVRCLWATQEWLFVGLSRTIYRVNYLPTESDLVFERGRAAAIVDPQHGVVGPRAVTSLSLEDLPSMVAFIDRYQGLVGCDGHRVYPLTEGLDWESKIAPEHLSRAILTNYAPWQALILYYVPRGGSTLSRALVFSYEAMHRRGPSTLSVTGPCRLPPTVAATLARDGVDVEGYTLDTSNRLWREFEATDEAEVGVAMTVRSRVFYPGGLGQEARIERLYVRYRDLAGCRIRATQTYEVVGGVLRKPLSQIYDRAIDIPQRGHVRLDLDGTAEAFQVELAALPDSGRAEDYTLGLDHFAWWVTAYGRQD